MGLNSHLPVNQRCLSCRLELRHSIRLLSLGRREVLSSWSLGSAPVALPDEERTPNGTRVALARLLVHNILLCLDHASCLSLIIDPDHLGAELKSPALGCGGKRFEEGYSSLTINDTARVEFRNTRYGRRSLGGVEVDNFLMGILES